MTIGDHELPTLEDFKRTAKDRGARCKHCTKRLNPEDLKVGFPTQGRNRHFIVVGVRTLYRSVYFICEYCGNITFWEQAVSTASNLPAVVPIVDVVTRRVLVTFGWCAVPFNNGSTHHWYLWSAKTLDGGRNEEL